MPSVTCSNLTIIESYGLSNKTYQNSILTIGFDVTWDGFSGFGYDGFGAYIQLHSGTNHSEYVNIYTQHAIYSSTAGSGTAHVTATINIADTGIGATYGNYFLAFTSEARKGTSYGLYSVVGYWDFTHSAYPAPTISLFTITRCQSDGTTDDSGTYGKISIAFSVFSARSTNTKALVIKYKKTSDSAWSTETISITSLGYSDAMTNHVLSASFLQTSAYDIQAVLTDSYTYTTNNKTVTAAYALVHFNAAKTQMAIGKYCETDGPGVDIDKDVLIQDISTFLARQAPYCRLSAPTSESMTYNSSRYCWIFSFQTVEHNDCSSFGLSAYSMLLGGSGGTRQMGFVIPRDGKYRVIMQVRLTSGSSSAMVGYIAKFASTWTPPSVNYLAEATMISQANAYNIGLAPAWNASNTWFQIVYDFDATAGEKVWPTAFTQDATKTIDNTQTWASIQQIG